MQNLCSALPTTRSEIFADLPIHRRFQTIFDGKRAAFDEEIPLKRRQSDDPRKSAYKFGVALRINIGVCDLRFGRA